MRLGVLSVAGLVALTSPGRPRPGGVRLSVRLTPKSNADRIEGTIERGGECWLAARVRAVPDKGAANAALTRLIARWLGLPRSAVTLSSGGKSRYKALDIVGEPVGLGRAIDAKIRQMTNG